MSMSPTSYLPDMSSTPRLRAPTVRPHVTARAHALLMHHSSAFNSPRSRRNLQQRSILLCSWPAYPSAVRARTHHLVSRHAPAAAHMLLRSMSFYAWPYGTATATGWPYRVAGWGAAWGTTCCGRA